MSTIGLDLDHGRSPVAFQVGPLNRRVLAYQGVQPGNPVQAPRAAAAVPAPGRCHQRSRHRDGPRPSHLQRTTSRLQIRLGHRQQRGGDSQRSNGQVLTTRTGARHPSSGYISPRPAGARSAARPRPGSDPVSADPPAATTTEPAEPLG